MKKLVLCFLLLLPASASAAFPGTNGDFVVSVNEGCELGVDLWRIPAGGGKETVLTDACERDEAYRFPEASPDGRSIFATDGNDFFGRVVTFDADGGVAPTEVPIPEGMETGLTGISLHPNGRSFAGEGDRFRNGREQEPMYRVFLDGGKAPRRIADTRFEAPRYSPNGKLLAVEVVRGSLKPGIWLIRARNGKPLRRLTNRGTDVDWSPDGKRLVYGTDYQQREDEGGASGGNLFVVRADGKGKPKALVSRDNIAETEPTWSPDGKSVAWVSLGFTDGDVAFKVFPSLWTVNVKTGKRKKLRELPQPRVEEALFHGPELTWLPGQ